MVEEYERFQCESPSTLSAREAEKIRALARNLPEVWNASSTSAIDRQEVARCLIERVSLSVPKNDENAHITITWAGGQQTNHTFRRPVFSYQQLEHFHEIREIVVTGRTRGLSHEQIVNQLNERGFRPPTERSDKFTVPLLRQLICRLGLAAPRRSDLLGKDEWWLREFAEMLGTTTCRVRYWVKNNFIKWRRLPGGQYIVWADDHELVRLAELRDWPPSRKAPPQLVTPNCRWDEKPAK